MNTPICDFVRRYAQRNALRMHMPGHKGIGALGIESLDITEIEGADSLYEADGIIRQSEANASVLFGCQTYYSTEGASHCIRAMLHLALLYGKARGRTATILAGRNAHKAFVSAAALLDASICWLYGCHSGSYLSCLIELPTLESLLIRERPAAVYLTSPDYLGNLTDLPDIAECCHRHGALLIVDNAHGAYLRFLSPSLHPMDLGADMACSSAHKTLPVLTGGAYLHLSEALEGEFRGQIRQAMALFGSTSPSYLILQSLDAANPVLAEYPALLAEFIPEITALKRRLTEAGYLLTGDEPMKLTLVCPPLGYTGPELARLLQQHGIFCEYSDPDFLVLMPAPPNGTEGLRRLERILLQLERRKALPMNPPLPSPCVRAMEIRQALLCASQTVPAAQSEGRILAAPSVGCPPAVPIVVSGEIIDANAVRCFSYYGICHCEVVAEPFHAHL
ncbi:MAG: aminotransferase class V-fold PLP-dependent enzyme [Christensenellales bacterium]|nr:aminotransferase class V-fold PLP-dependent enzyme [Christensenellales bacterium]